GQVAKGERTRRRGPPSVILFIIEGQRALQVGPRSDQVTRGMSYDSLRDLSPDPPCSRSFSLGRSHDLPCDLPRGVQITTSQGHTPHSKQKKQQLRRIDDAIAEFPGSGERRRRLGTETPRLVQSRTQGDLERELLLCSSWRVRQRSQRFESLGEMTNPFREGEPRNGALSGLTPRGHCRLQFPSLGVVVREELRLGVSDLGELFSEYSRNLSVQLPASALQQRAVGRLSDQCMLEEVVRIGRQPARVDELCIGQAYQRLLE